MLGELDARLGVELEGLARRLRTLAGGDGVRALAGDEALLEQTVEAVVARTELGRVAPTMERGELRTVYGAAARG